MQVTWVIERGIFPEEYLLHGMLMNLGIPCVLVDNFEQASSVDEDCVVFHGSLRTAKLVNRRVSWIPGVYCDLAKYNCLNYYPVLGGYLLNHNYIMLPGADLLRRKSFIYSLFGGAFAPVFIRPAAGDKPFHGTLVSEDEFEQVSNMEGLVVIAREQQICAEWRFVVVEGRVITGSLYAGDSGEYKKAAKVAQEVANLYNPEPAWTVDICESPTGHHLLEINSFSCAGLYQCNYEKVVQAVSRVALKEWEEVICG